MATLAITRDTIAVHLEQQHLELIGIDADDGDGRRRINVPLRDIERVVVSGCPSISLQAMHALMRNGIPVSFISSHHRWLGALTTDNLANAKRRIAQYKASENEDFRLVVASELVHCKIRNCRRVLQRLAGARKESDTLEQTEATRSLAELAHRVSRIPESMESLRGYEGMAAAVYFSRLKGFFPENLPFEARSKHPPLNAANAIMSWTYAIVTGEIVTAIKTHGLDPYLGFLHDISYNQPSLACDLIEPLRAPLCDMLVMHLLNHRILRPEHFESHGCDDGVYLNANGKRAFFPAYEAAMEREFSRPHEDGHDTFRKVIDEQVLAIVGVLEGKSRYEFFAMP